MNLDENIYNEALNLEKEKNTKLKKLFSEISDLSKENETILDNINKLLIPKEPIKESITESINPYKNIYDKVLVLKRSEERINTEMKNKKLLKLFSEISYLPIESKDKIPLELYDSFINLKEPYYPKLDIVINIINKYKNPDILFVNWLKNYVDNLQLSKNINDDSYGRNYYM